MNTMVPCNRRVPITTIVNFGTRAGSSVSARLFLLASILLFFPFPSLLARVVFTRWLDLLILCAFGLALIFALFSAKWILCTTKFLKVRETQQNIWNKFCC